MATFVRNPYYPAGYQQHQLTEFVTNVSPPNDAVRVTIQPTGQSIRFRDDSIAPTVNTGMLVANDSTYILDSLTASLQLITTANTTPPVNADANLASGPVNSDVTFIAADTGPEWNGYHFAIVEDAVVGVNSSAIQNSAAVNSDVTYTSTVQNPVWDGYTFTTVLDATVGANAAATLLSAPVNSDLTFTAAEKEDKWNDYNFTVAQDANAGVNATAILLSAAVNADITFTAAAKEDSWNAYNFTTVADANAGANASAILLSVAVNSDITFTAVAKEDSWNAYNFTTVADATAGANAVATLACVAVNADLTFTAVEKEDKWNGYSFALVTDVVAGANASAILLSAAVNSDLTFTAVEKEDKWNNYNFTTVTDANAGANATATLNINAANGDLVFTSPTKSATHNGMNFTASSNGAEAVTYIAGTFTLEFNTTVSNGSTMKTVFDAAIVANPGWPQWTCAVEGDGSGAWVAADDDTETIASASGVDVVAEEILFSGGNTFTIHIFPANTAADVVTLWAGGPANCANFAIADEGDGSGAVDAGTIASAGGIDTGPLLIEFAANTFTIHTLATTVANEVVTLWAGGPANCANFAIADDGNGNGIVDAGTDISAGGIDVIAPFIGFAGNTFTIHIVAASTTAADIVALWAGGPANCANWAIADEGDGAGAVGATTVASAGGVDVIAPYIEFAVNTFTIHILPTSIGSEVVTLWGDPGSPANCANFAIVDEGDGTGVVDATTVASAGGVDITNPYISYAAPNSFTIHTLAANTAADVVALWALGPANCANFAIADEGDGTGAVGAGTIASAGGIDILVPYINFAVNAFTIHAYAAAIASDIVALWAAGPANCANWACTDEGDGTGVVQAVVGTSAGGAIPIATSLDFAGHTFTFHTYPAVSTAADCAALWAGGPANCANFAIADEGNGNGAVAATTSTSANGADAVGAIVNLLWHKDS